MTDLERTLYDALKRMDAMHKMMMAKVNHGASAYDAVTIQEMNEAPIQAAQAVALATKQGALKASQANTDVRQRRTYLETRLNRKENKMKNIICIYHGNCADGFGAAWAVRHALGEDDVEYYLGGYQQDPPDVTGKHVIIVDLSYKRDVIIKMAESAATILIFDHHKSAASDLAAYLPPPTCGYIPNQWLSDAKVHNMHDTVYAEFDTQRSGAMIAWDFFHPLQSAPSLIYYIQDRALSRFKLSGTREIQAALLSYPYDFKVWDDLMKSGPNFLREQGEAIERKHFEYISEFIEVAASRVVIAGFDVPCLNAPYFYSNDALHIMAKGEPFAACYFDVPEGRSFSLRSHEDGEDVSAIAMQFDGGGGKYAAGFRVPHDHELCRIVLG